MLTSYNKAQNTKIVPLVATCRRTDLALPPKREREREREKATRFTAFIIRIPRSMLFESLLVHPQTEQQRSYRYTEIQKLHR